MHKLLIRTAVAGLATAALLSLAPAAFAQAVTYKADLTGAAQVPPNTTKGTGTLAATYDPASKKLSYTVNYKDLSGPATAAHFHGPAAAGANARVVVPGAAPPSSPTFSFPNSLAMPVISSLVGSTTYLRARMRCQPEARPGAMDG